MVSGPTVIASNCFVGTCGVAQARVQARYQLAEVETVWSG